ncbi:serine/threonine-protein kinase Nek5-like [Conger conger]|uniref:serine/threonine-protein kinase Nek5-like n=1 Tax=Conger conger TaxID=82655 RepID=UPI002A59AFB1|nr:serine/threonine-protein kinase Nek5-like [Conger conger]XP_061107041.1 serine/threonine-protein kinase Nek5-like [Conger conger]
MGNRASILEERGYYEDKEIGQGAFGKVFRVKKKADEKEYVVKAVQKSESVIHEVAALKALKHPFIVEYNDSFEDIMNLYIVMEYCKGGDLSQKIKNQKDTGGYFTEDQILSWFAEISSAVQHVHENNILHRDIMPQVLAAGCYDTTM